MALLAAMLKGTSNMDDDKNGFVGGFIKGFCVVFFGGIIIVLILIALALG